MGPQLISGNHFGIFGNYDPMCDVTGENGAQNELKLSFHTNEAHANIPSNKPPLVNTQAGRQTDRLVVVYECV